MRRALGELEQQVLLTILHLGGESYSVPIVTELEKRSGREVSQAAVYIVLRRLEEKGLVSSRTQHAEETDTARERRYFRVLPGAIGLLRDARSTMARFWDGLDRLLEERS